MTECLIPKMLHAEIRIFWSFCNCFDKQHQRAYARKLAQRAIGTFPEFATYSVSSSGAVPNWPKDLLGSIAHCGPLIVCAIACKSESEALGIDIEAYQRITLDDLAPICSRTELVNIESLNHQDASIPWGIVMFSAKESLFKASYSGRTQQYTISACSVEIKRNGQLRGEVEGVNGIFRGNWHFEEKSSEMSDVVFTIFLDKSRD